MTSDPFDPGVNPFADPPHTRDPVRRFRGRLVAPVTIATAGTGRDKAGLTVSSLMVAEGEPGLVYLLVGATTDFYTQLSDTRRFIVHICTAAQQELADVFAGLKPSPGGIFAGRATSDSDYGTILDDIDTRAYCSLLDTSEESYSVLVSAAIDRVDAGDLLNPLSYHRGKYGRLS